MIIDRMRAIARGRAVWTADDAKLGTVKDVRLDGFKVGAPKQPSYWLPMSTVRSSGPDGLQLAFEKDHLSDFKREEPTKAIRPPYG
jgi:hypothetical protein